MEVLRGIGCGIRLNLLRVIQDRRREVIEMRRNLSKLAAFLIAIVLFGAACSESGPPSDSPVDIDIEATISAGIAATQAALPELDIDEPPPTATQELAVEPQLEAPAQDDPNAPIETSTPSATRVDTSPPLALPFFDGFDQGLRPEWRVINGRPLVSEGRLTSAVDELSMEIGNTSLQNYTLSFDVSGDDGCGSGYGNDLVIGFSPTQRLSYYDTDFSGRLRWYTFDNNDWVKIDEQDGIDCGHFEIDVFGNSYQVRVNGSLASELVYEPAQGPLLVSIDEDVNIDNLEIR